MTIENIKAGDLVWATDPETGETALKPVVQTFRNTTEEWIHVTVDGEELTCTPEHPFYSPVKGWTSACQLRAGDILVTLNGEYVVVEQVQHELLECPETTYNFEVEGFHTYYVGNAEVLVHNECGDVYRGGNKMKVRESDIEIKGGLVQPTRGVSVNSNPNAVRSFGTPHKVGPLPDGLQLKHTSGTHYEIIPAYAMELDTYKSLLNKILLTPIGG